MTQTVLCSSEITENRMLYKSLTPVAISYITNSLISIVNQHWYLTVTGPSQKN